MNERELFMGALDFSNPEERTAFLDEKCATDPELRRRIETLLAAHEGAGSFLGIPVADRLANHAVPPLTADETQGMSVDEGMTESLDFLTPSQQPGSLGHLGHYEVLEVIGRGGFGIVVRAFDEKLHRVVAIKLMAPQLAATSAPRKRFLREARAAAAIKHDNVISIFSVEEQPLPYLVMEYIAGPTLQQKLDANGPLEVAEIVRFGQQIANGLAAAHGMRLIHRDIKPGNILLENGIEPRVKITDFGLARAADDASTTQSGVIAGTPMYMAPEQACGAVLDHRADLFSLGSVLYVMCSGRPPFRAANSIAVLKRVVEDMPRPVQEIIPETPAWLGDIIARLHAKKPEDRFQSAKEVADLLGRCWAEMQQQGHVTSLPSPAENVLPSKVPHPKAGRLGRVIGGRRWATVAAVLLLLLGGLGLSEATGLSRLTTTIIRIATGEGTLVVESGDPGVKLLIDGEQITISGAGVEEVRLRPGSYKLAAMRDGKPIKLDQELVTINRDGRQVVRVLLEPERAKRTETLPTADPWVSLFNGKDLTGWQAAEGTSEWLVKDNILTSSGSQMYLFSERSDYEDFHLRAEVRINSLGNSGILVRTTPVAKDLVFNGHRYRLVRKVVSWEEAKAEAEAQGGHLATITSQSENDWVRQQYGSYLTTPSTGFWLGASQALPDAPWKWVTDEPFAYSNWALNEPNCRVNDDENQPPYYLNFYYSLYYPTQMGWNDSALGPSTRWKTQSIGYLIEWDSLRAEGLESDFNRPGYEAQICADISGQPKTGSLFKTWPWTCVAKVDPSPVPAGTWFQLEIIARGGRYVVKVNDVQTAEHTTPYYPQDSGHIALQQYGSQTRVEFRTIEIQEFPSFRPESNAFVRLERPGGKEQAYDTLDDAVKASRAGDAIEVRGNGPFVTQHIAVKQPLTIRAAEGFRPVIQLDRESTARRRPLIWTKAPLILEGITLERRGEGAGNQDKSIPYGFLLQGWSEGVIYAANCRFLNGHGPCFQIYEVSHNTLPDCKTGRVLNSECLSYKFSLVQKTQLQLDVENSILAGWIDLSLPQAGSDQWWLCLTHNTMCGGVGLSMDQLPMSTEPLAVKPRVRLDLASNIVPDGIAVIGMSLLTADSPPLATELEDFVRSSVDWNEARNLYGQSGLSIHSVSIHPITNDRKYFSPSLKPGLNEWNAFWNQDNTGAIEASPLFQGGNLIDRASKSLDSLTAEDFRLRPESPGYRAGADGKDLGPDIDLVGPGEAYERWKKTPEYQEWLKETQRLMQDSKGEQATLAKPLHQLLGCTSAILKVAFAPDGKSVFAARQTKICQWDLTKGTLLAEYNLAKETFAGFLPLQDGRRLLTSEGQGRIQLWDLETKQSMRAFVGHTKFTAGLAFSPDESLLLTGSDDKTVRLWDMETGEQLHQFSSGWCRTVAFSPDGKIAAFVNEGGVAVFDVSTREVLRGLANLNANPRALAISADNRFLLAGLDDGKLKLLDVNSGSLLQELRFDKHVRSCGFAPDGRHFFAGSEDRTLCMFNTESGEEVFRIDEQSHCTNYVAISPDGRFLASGGGTYLVNPETFEYEADGDFVVRLWQLPESIWSNSETTPANNPKSTPVAPVK